MKNKFKDAEKNRHHLNATYIFSLAEFFSRRKSVDSSRNNDELTLYERN
jgi:hypothetical protein